MKYFILCAMFIISAFAQPSWVNNPTNNQYIGGVGIGKNISERRLAMVLARAELFESIKVNLKSGTIIEKVRSENNYSSSFSQKIIQKAKGSLENSFVKDTYTDKDGRYYVWMVIISTTFEAYPHSLSYQITNFIILPCFTSVNL